jgi:peptidyl-prolyl cis-trans isomerase D
MLEFMRKIGGNKFFRILFALFLIIPFGLFGIDYYFKGPVGGDTVATVGGYRISGAEFDQSLRQQTENYRQQFGRNFDPAIMDNPEMRRNVLDGVINQRLVAAAAEREGIAVSDEVLAARIAAEPVFQSEGKFSMERYKSILKAQGMGEAGFERQIREDYRLQQFRSSILDTAIVPRSTVDAFVRISEQSRDVSLVNLAPDQYLAKVKVTPEQVKAWYDSHLVDYTIPEQARVEFVELSLDALAARAQVTPEEVKAFYEANQGRFLQKEERRASHILISAGADAKPEERKAARAKAQAIFEQVTKKPASFAEIAKKESQDPGSAVQGGDLGFFPRGAMVKPFEDAAYAGKKDDIVGPVESDFGYHVIRITDVKPEKGKSVAEATPEIEAELKKQVAARKFAESAEQFSNLVYEQPTSLKPAADALKLAVQQSGWFSKASGAPPLLANPKLIQEIFSEDSTKAKRNTTAVEVGPNVLVSARVSELKPSEVRPLEAVKADIERRLLRDAAAKLATEDGEAKLKELREGKAVDLKWPAPLAVSRARAGGLFPQVLDEVFRADARKLPAYAGVAMPGGGYALLQVTKVNEPGAIDDAKRAAMRERLAQAVTAQEFESELGSLRKQIDVSVRKDAVDKKPQ